MKTRLSIAILVLSMLVSSNPIAGGSSDEYSLGKVEWPYKCHPLLFNVGMVRVIDSDMNLDDNTPDSFDIEVYSDYDESNIQNYVNPIHTVVETDNSTGIFEGMIFWGDPHDEGIGHRVPIWDNVTATAKYTDYTLPSSYSTSEVNVTGSIIVKDVKPIKQTRSNDDDFYYIYEPCTIELLDMKKNPHSDVHEFIFPPPSQQLESGLLMEQLHCKQNLVLIQKYDGSPACVTESTKTKLVERGWTKGVMDYTNSHPCQKLAFEAFASTTLKRASNTDSDLSVGYGEGENEEFLRSIGCYENRKEWQTQEFLDYLNELLKNKTKFPQ